MAFPALASPLGSATAAPTPVGNFTAVPDTPPGRGVQLNAPTPAPTVDRVAAPPTVVNPNQADTGAQLFWLHCQPCHGDQAQGLTDEWRAQYPPEDQNCWKSGCHGDRPYQNGFILPHTVPALLGASSLSHFATAADLYTFMSHAMPFQAPGSLKPAEYWAITAFLLRGHGLPAADLPLNDAAIAQNIPLGASATSTGVQLNAPTPARGSNAPTPTPTGGVQSNAPTPTAGVPPVVAVAVTVAAALVLGGLGRLVGRRSPPHG